MRQETMRQGTLDSDMWLEQPSMGSRLERRQVKPGEDDERAEWRAVHVKMKMKNWFSGRDLKIIIKRSYALQQEIQAHKQTLGGCSAG